MPHKAVRRAAAYLRPMFCVFDIESTGGKFGKEAIMEIALYRFDGEEVTDQLISLVHPHKPVQKFVSKMTGITEKMLARAPRFHEIAKRLVEITKDAVLVGHNVEFDYRMLRQEFNRLGYPFERKTLDTITLSEELIPDLESYGLSKVCKALDIHHSNKHRADVDARATLDLFKILREKDQQKKISVVGQSVQHTDWMKHKISDLQRAAKNQRGLFYLHDAEGKLLYIEASDNVKNALSRILIAENQRGKELREKTQSVKTEAAGNWLVARIKKFEELGKAKPPYNSKPNKNLQFGIAGDFRQKPAKLYLSDLESLGKKKPLAKAANEKSASRALRMFQRRRNNQDKYALLELLKNWPTDAIFSGRGRKRNEYCAFVIQESKLSGYFYYSLNEDLKDFKKIEKKLIPIADSEFFTELLKLGILSGEFRKVDFI